MFDFVSNQLLPFVVLDESYKSAKNLLPFIGKILTPVSLLTINVISASRQVTLFYNYLNSIAMKKLKSLLTFALVGITSIAFAQATLVVNNNPGAPGGDDVYSTFADALTAATAGDIIYMVPSSTSYGHLNVTKGVTIFGAGSRTTTKRKNNGATPRRTCANRWASHEMMNRIRDSDWRNRSRDWALTCSGKTDTPTRNPCSPSVSNCVAALQQRKIGSSGTHRVCSVKRSRQIRRVSRKRSACWSKRPGALNK